MAGLGIEEFQQLIERIYGKRDSARGLEGTYMWFVEEIGELARAFLTEPRDGEAEGREFADVLAWLATLASLRGVRLAEVAEAKYSGGCPRCESTPCACQHRS